MLYPAQYSTLKGQTSLRSTRKLRNERLGSLFFNKKKIILGTVRYMLFRYSVVTYMEVSNLVQYDTKAAPQHRALTCACRYSCYFLKLLEWSPLCDHPLDGLRILELCYFDDSYRSIRRLRWLSKVTVPQYGSIPAFPTFTYVLVVKTP